MLEKKKSLEGSSVIICILFLYPLFIFNTIKQFGSPIIDGVKTTNLLWIIPAIILIKVFLNLKKYKADKRNGNSIIFFLLLFIVILVGAFNIENTEQYILAICIFIEPIGLIFLFDRNNIKDKNFFLKFFVMICLIYSILTIINAVGIANFEFLKSSDYVTSGQSRARLMIGSTISLSNYFVMTVPLLFYMYFTVAEIKWRIISLSSIVLSFIATCFTLSRMGVTSFLIISILCFVMFKGKKLTNTNKLIIFIFICIAGYYLYLNYDISRLFSFNDASISQRGNSLNLALNIFKNNPIFGSGIGRYFLRAYDYNFINVNGYIGMVDPHNMYALILSELGLSGFIILFTLLVCMLSKFSTIEDQLLKKTAYMTILGVALFSLGGSHIINEINFSMIFWIYIGFFYIFSSYDEN